MGCLGLALLAACGGSDGSDTSVANTGDQITDPVIPLVGTTGRYSMTPEEANAALGTSPPPLMPANAPSQNQFLRLECPFTVERGSILSTSTFLAPFSQLNGNITITDAVGNHLPCIVLVNGVDAFGKKRSSEPGFPQSLNAAGKDLNVGPGVILFVADSGDGDLSTIAAFGGRTNDTDLRADTTEITQIRLTFTEVNSTKISAFYTVTVGPAGSSDTVGPTVLSVTADTPSSAAPLDPAQVGPTTRFVVRFSEPVVPTTVGESSKLDSPPYTANMPILPPPPLTPQPPLPHTYITTLLNLTAQPLFIPCDVEPLNSNNLATYVVRPLLDLPTQARVDLILVDASNNRNPGTGVNQGAFDLAGNFHLPGSDVRRTFTVGPGRVAVNAPVSPEVLYWIPANSRGIGAVDLNGMGFTTNTPGANKDDYRRAAIITKISQFNPIDGIGIQGHPPERGHNGYRWPVGTGSFTYGPRANDPTDPAYNPNAPLWAAGQTDPNGGNTGTPVPGINEMSSGYETLVRNAAGEVILTGPDNQMVGRIQDAIVGEFLDAAIFDTQNAFVDPSFHLCSFAQPYGWGNAIANNSIGEPPVPNPPPLRYWVGLQPVDILVDQANPGAPARLIEGEEIWAGTVRRSYHWVMPNPKSEIGIDSLPPHILIRGVGPVPQTFSSPPSFTVNPLYTARQQIGNFLYVTDLQNRQVHAINSNTFQVIESIDLPDPVGLGISPTGRFLFVSNASDDSLSVLGADPRRPDFHQEVARIDVGRNPGDVAVQPDGEDVFVANRSSNEVSIINLQTLTVRKTLSVLISGPGDIVVTPRQTAFGFITAVYHAYISNLSGNSVVLYESGPDGPQGIGCNDILGALPTDEQINVEFFEPRGMCYSPYFNDTGVLAGGIYLAHRTTDGTGMVSRIEFTHQIIPGPLPCNPPPGFFQVPLGFNDRSFEVVGQWGADPSNRLAGSRPTSVVLADIDRKAYMTVPTEPPNFSDIGGAPTTGASGLNSRHPVRFVGNLPFGPYFPTYTPDRMYVSFEDSPNIQVLNPTKVGVSLKVIEPAGVGVRKLVTYFQQ